MTPHEAAAIFEAALPKHLWLTLERLGSPDSLHQWNDFSDEGATDPLLEDASWVSPEHKARAIANPVYFWHLDWQMPSGEFGRRLACDLGTLLGYPGAEFIDVVLASLSDYRSDITVHHNWFRNHIHWDEENQDVWHEILNGTDFDNDIEYNAFPEKRSLWKLYLHRPELRDMEEHCFTDLGRMLDIVKRRATNFDDPSNCALRDSLGLTRDILDACGFCGGRCKGWC